MTLKQIYRELQAKPRALTPDELALAMKADWQTTFDLYLLSRNPELEARLAELQPKRS